ncbi:MAG: hypothetical protein WBS33_10575, partial [Verrucomicrobiia bacterium]
FHFRFCPNRIGCWVMRVAKIIIKGMSGLDCAICVQRALAAVPTVKGVRVALGQATVELEDSSDEPLFRAIQMAGDYRGEIKRPALIPSKSSSSAGETPEV